MTSFKNLYVGRIYCIYLSEFSGAASFRFGHLLHIPGRFLFVIHICSYHGALFSNDVTSFLISCGPRVKFASRATQGRNDPARQASLSHGWRSANVGAGVTVQIRKERGRPPPSSRTSPSFHNLYNPKIAASQIDRGLTSFPSRIAMHLPSLLRSQPRSITSLLSCHFRPSWAVVSVYSPRRLPTCHSHRISPEYPHLCFCRTRSFLFSLTHRHFPLVASR